MTGGRLQNYDVFSFSDGFPKFLRTFSNISWHDSYYYDFYQTIRLSALVSVEVIINSKLNWDYQPSSRADNIIVKYSADPRSNLLPRSFWCLWSEHAGDLGTSSISNVP